ncbi:polysaccharide biosynthesis C-terminal domain-containing protein [Ruminococcus sp. OA3]|uniref:MATE family efflux transporter n=1 Tax=Ruminococcus sp. OA3 TaxID=2914164 RepID=UPI001F0534FF|nr:MATE family efflux transporter [Ruminococcus sp. OA3]MCH1983990.1 polysaccharide biosynthesis C-terminal domain-containing protein [Ruminococcus sp. OA3]
MNNNKMFFKFVIPSVLAFALSGVYTIVDGFFVGQSIGDIGLASITLGFPVAAFIQAVGTGIGLSGAIRFTILSGQEKKKEAEECFSSTAFLLFLVSVFIMTAILLLIHPLLSLLGAEGEAYRLTAEYVRIIALGTVFQVFATGLVPFIRNLGGATFAMAAMIAGFLSNILLDYLFVWIYGFGMAGAAWATIIGQSVTMLAAISFLTVKRIGFKLPELKKLLSFSGTILKVSIAPFGLTFSPQITTILMNRFLLMHGGEQSVAVYGCIAYITAVVYLLLQGVGDGSQPLISRYYSENKKDIMKQIRKLAYLTSGAIGLICMTGLFFARRYAGFLFGASVKTNQDVSSYLPMFLVTLVFLAYVRITTAYFYATEKSILSYLLVYAEPVLLFVLLILLPSVPVLGLSGVWMSVPLAQFITWMISVFAKRGVDRVTAKKACDEKKRTMSNA